MPIRVVTFDAAGTLIRVREPVGRTYGRLAREAGIEVGDDALESGFRRALSGAPPLTVARELDAAARALAEREWWRRIVRSTLAAAAPADQATAPATFESFFASAFAHYASPDAWQVYADVEPALRELRASCRLGVLSNFDGRLHAILDGLGLARFFDTVVVSSEVGAAKPEREIFQHAARELGADAEACLHVGDSLQADAAGACRAGWRGIWLVRPGPAEPAVGESGGENEDTAPQIASLSELPGLLQ